MRFSSILCFAVIISLSSQAQTPNQIQPYSFDFYQKLNEEVYNKSSSVHSSLKPFFKDDSLIRHKADSVLHYGSDTSLKNWFLRKTFNEHLIEINRKEYNVFADFLYDFQVGRDLSTSKATWLNTRGYQIGGNIGDKFSFLTSGFENQAVFASYYQNYIDKTNVIPGQSYDRNQYPVPLSKKDWSYVSAVISYTPSKYINITLGQDKTFIGDGYRSMILSDFAANYPFIKVTANLGNVQYMSMWTSMQDPSAPVLSPTVGWRKKGGIFHYLDWNVNKRLSVGFFESVIWAGTDSAGNRRGFDLGYLNPIIFLRPIEAMNGSPDNVMIGTNWKYELLKNTAVYGQFVLDEFEARNFFAGNGSSRNKWGLQLGLRGANLLSVKRLNYLLEYNTARPYTYSERSTVINYGHYNEPLAHPFGANFKELVGILSYSYKRFGFSGQFNTANYGLDYAGGNYGKDIFQNYDNPASKTGTFIGQGLSTQFNYLDGRVSFMLNPRFNARVELGLVHRSETNSLTKDKTNWITFGIRTSFRNLYQDF